MNETIKVIVNETIEVTGSETIEVTVSLSWVERSKASRLPTSCSLVVETGVVWHRCNLLNSQ